LSVSGGRNPDNAGTITVWRTTLAKGIGSTASGSTQTSHISGLYMEFSHRWEEGYVYGTSSHF
jgi:hypothetical protein